MILEGLGAELRQCMNWVHKTLKACKAVFWKFSFLGRQASLR